MAGLFVFIALIIFVVILVTFSNLQNRITGLQLQIQALKNRVDNLTPAQQMEMSKNQTMQPNASPSLSTELAQSKQLPEAFSSQQQSVFVPATPEISKPSPTTTNSTFRPITQSSTELTANSPHTSSSSIEHNSFIQSSLVQWLIKGNPVAKVAIVILFFGLSYLLKYSIDHGLLSPEIRIIGSLGLGLVLLTIGWRLRKKKALYALILQGGAIGVLYLTLFAAFKLYALVPLLLVFALLVIVCATSVMFAVLQRAISLAIIACVGGYLAPILLSTGSGNHIALFSYYLLISSAILVISFWQSWRALNLIGFIFTFVVAILWGVKSFRADFYLECQIFILANMLIYGVLAVLLSVRNTHKESYQNAFDLTLLFSVPLIAYGLQYAITEHWQYAPAFSALGFGLFYLIGSFVVLRIWHGRAKQLALYGLAIGLAFSTLAVPLAVSADLTALIWLFEGTAISYATLTQKQYRFAWAGTVIVLLGSISAIIATDNPLNNTEFITLYGVMSIVILLNACLWHHYRAVHTSSEAIKNLFIVMATLAWSTWIIGSVIRVFEPLRYLVLPIMACYVIATWLWFFIGRKLNWLVLRYSLIALWPVLLLSLLHNMSFYIHDYYAGVWGLSWFVAFISGYIFLYLEKDNLAKNSIIFANILHISLFWIVLAWLYYNICWLLSFLPWGFDVVKWSVLTVVASIIILIFFVLERYRCFPIHLYKTQYWLIALLPLSLYLLLNLITGLFSSGQIIYWTYIPMINPLEESAAFSLIMLTVWLSQSVKLLAKQQSIDSTQIRSSLITSLFVIIAIFLWGNSIILRGLSQWLDISWSLYALWHNNIVQVVLSLVWMSTAVVLVAIAHRYLLRNVWFAGAGLQAIVVLKLVFVDSVELDGLMRAFVFIGVALLMLVIGYLAPLPPKNRVIEANK